MILLSAFNFSINFAAGSIYKYAGLCDNYDEMKRFLLVIIIVVLLLSAVYLTAVIVKNKLASNLPLNQATSSSSVPTKPKIDESPSPNILKVSRSTKPIVQYSTSAIHPKELPPFEKTID